MFAGGKTAKAAFELLQDAVKLPLKEVGSSASVNAPISRDGINVNAILRLLNGEEKKKLPVIPVIHGSLDPPASNDPEKDSSTSDPEKDSSTSGGKKAKSILELIKDLEVLLIDAGSSEEKKEPETTSGKKAIARLHLYNDDKKDSSSTGGSTGSVNASESSDDASSDVTKKSETKSGVKAIAILHLWNGQDREKILLIDDPEKDSSTRDSNESISSDSAVDAGESSPTPGSSSSSTHGSV
ncbi:hypothetical protein OJAV_G00113770 [Oryzias javanicus]|uniref:Uncharacterized protein n=1 Tax=Oryzias javanicus TaxID=123683 RepID=A0A3S2P5G5_ORYJA|nr:hypothetical protein OJAV_G00113770 [Oryzias javanicus]